MKLGRTLVIAWAAAAAAGSALAGPDGIYTCVDSRGHRLTSDRPIQECIDREQRVLNPDGSQKRIHPPTLTAEERFKLEEQEHAKQREQASKMDAARRDRNLMTRYKSEGAHNKARQAALDDVQQAIKTSADRLKQLQAERKPLLNEAEFYKGKKLPAKLRQQLDDNEASTDAQNALIQNQQVELKRINANFDAELAHLRKLWAGALPGSIPFLPASAASGAASGPAGRAPASH